MHPGVLQLYLDLQKDSGWTPWALGDCVECSLMTISFCEFQEVLFLKDQTEYLGNRISSKGIATDMAKLAAVRV